MKAVKIVLISFLTLIICALAGLMIFLKSFDLNAYVPQLTQTLTQALGREVRIGHAGLGVSFLRGVSATLKDIVVMDDPRFSSEAFISVGDVFLGVDFKEFLFKQKLVIGDITINKLDATVIRSKEGLVNAAMIGASKKEEAQADNKKDGAAAAALPVFLVQEVKVLGARVTYIDEAVSPKMTVRAEKIDLVVKDFSLSDPFSVALKMGLFSDEQNMALDAKIKVELKNLGVKVSQVVVSTDLSKLSRKKLIEAVASLEPLALQTLKGIVTLRVDEASANILGVTSLKGQLLAEQGYVLTGLSPVAIDDFSAKVRFNAQQADIESISVAVAGGTIQGQGTIEKYLSSPQARLKFTMALIDTGRISDAYKLPAKMKGLLEGTASVAFSGKTPQEITSSLTAESQFDLKGGSLEGINLLENALAGVPLLSGVWASVVADFPADTQADLKKGVTLIDRAGGKIHVTGMDLFVDQAELVTRDVAVSASGQARLVDTVDIKGDLLVSSQISDVLVGKLSDLEALRGQDGRLRIPFLVDGKLVAPKVHADEKYLTKAVLAQRGKKELEKLADKNPAVAGVFNAIFGGNSDATTQEDQGTSSSQETGAGSKAVDGLLNTIFNKN